MTGLSKIFGLCAAMLPIAAVGDDLNLSTVSVAYGGWEMIPMAGYKIDEVRKHPTYRIDSENYDFVKYVEKAMTEGKLEPCSFDVDSWHGIRLVVDLKRDGKTSTFISDGIRLFTADKKRCRPIDDEFKDKFRIKPFGQ
jgi:hypothetical protein